jgi:hypothetical protein
MFRSIIGTFWKGVTPHKASSPAFGDPWGSQSLLQRGKLSDDRPFSAAPAFLKFLVRAPMGLVSFSFSIFCL